jgi:hypothetical protein
MQEILNELNKTLQANLCYSTLFLIVAIPDICAALESDNNLSDRTKYKNWFNKYFSSIAPTKYGVSGTLKAEDLYYIRCSLLHQGQTTNKGVYKRLLFLEPGTEEYEQVKSLHCVMVGNDTNEKSLLVNIVQLSNDMNTAVKEWMAEFENDNNYINNSKKLINRHPNGIAPILGGIVIG